MAEDDLFGEDYMFFYADDASDASVERDVDIILRLLDLPLEARSLKSAAARGGSCASLRVAAIGRLGSIGAAR